MPAEDTGSGVVSPLECYPVRKLAVRRPAFRTYTMHRAAAASPQGHAQKRIAMLSELPPTRRGLGAADAFQEAR